MAYLRVARIPGLTLAVSTFLNDDAPPAAMGLPRKGRAVFRREER
jgi:hypothetical protein